MSQRSASSCKSQQSNIFSLSSKQSQRNAQENQLQTFKQKLSKLFDVKTSNLADLFCQIQDKYSNKFVQQKIIEFDEMLSSLNNIKRNNRQMAKLVSILGLKAENKSKQEQIKNHNQNQHFNGDILQIQQTNPTEASEQYYNFKHKPINPAFNIIFQNGIDKKNTTQQNILNEQIYPRQKQKSYYEIYQQKNIVYEDKIKRMLDELSIIKVQLDRNKDGQSDYQFHESNSTVKATEAKNMKSGNFEGSKNGQLKKQVRQQKQLKYDSNNIPTNKELTQNSWKLKQYIQKTDTRNKGLIEQAKSISRKLEQIKAQTIKFEKGIDFQSIDQNLNRNQNYSINNSINNKLNSIKNNLNDNNQIDCYFADLLCQNQKSLNDLQKQHQIRYTQRRNQKQNQNANQVKTENQDQNRKEHKKQQENQNSYQKQNLNQKHQAHQTKYHQKQNLDNLESNRKSSSQQSQFSIENHEQPKQKYHFQKKKSILDEMKNVQSKVLISENQIIQPFIGSTINNLANQNYSNQPNKQSKNFVSHGSVRNSLSDSISQSSSKQVVISYLTMQQPSNNKKWQSNSFQKRQNVNNFNKQSIGRTFEENSSQNEKKSLINQISPSQNNISNYHNTSIMNARGPANIVNQIPNNSSVIKVQWRSPQILEPYARRQNRISQRSNQKVQIISNQPYSRSKQKVMLHQNSNRSNSLIRNGSALLTQTGPIVPNQNRRINQSFVLNSKPLIVQNDSNKRLSVFQPSIVSHQSRNSLPIATYTQITPIKQPFPVRVGQQISSIHRAPSTHSNSAINISINDFQNRFKNISNRSSFSQQKTGNQSFLKNSSYLTKQNNSVSPVNTLNSQNFKILNNFEKINNNSYYNPQNKALTNPFDQIKEQNQFQKRQRIRPSFKKQIVTLGSKRFSSEYNGDNISFVNSKVQAYGTLGNSSKLSRDSRDSKSSRKSKGLQVFSHII